MTRGGRRPTGAQTSFYAATGPLKGIRFVFCFVCIVRDFMCTCICTCTCTCTVHARARACACACHVIVVVVHMCVPSCKPISYSIGWPTFKCTFGPPCASCRTRPRSTSLSELKVGKWLSVCICACTQAHAHMYAHVHAHKHMHTCMHMCMHMHICKPKYICKSNICMCEGVT